MKKLITPKNYLSYSQIDMWLRNREKYKRKYFFGENVDDVNDYMVFGKKTAHAIETGEATGDELFDMAVSLIPKYDIIEHEIRVPLVTPYGEIDLLGKLDTFCPTTLKFREYKTGKSVWTQRRADTHKQLYHYQTMIWLQNKKLSPEIHLDWFETDKTESGVTFTGKVKSFRVKIGLAEVLSYMTLVGQVAVQIDTEYKKECEKLFI